MAKPKKTITEKVQKTLPDFADEVASLGVADLNNRLLGIAKEAERSEQAKEDDEDLTDALAAASEMGAPYRDAKKAARMKSKYLMHLIKEKGGA